MKQPSAEVLELMLRAADLRAGGSSWESVGRELQRHADSCRRWAREYPDLWRKLYREAEQRLAGESRAEARVVMRQLLRSEQEKTRLAAAHDLLISISRPRGRKSAPPADREVAAFISQLRGLNDGELEEMLRRFLASCGGDAAGMAGSAVPNPAQ